MATVVNESDIFTCSICLEKLKSPKSLPCLHTFCELCIGEFILSTERRAGHKLKSYPCPVCRSVVTPTKPKDETSLWASALPHNFLIASLMDQSESTGTKQECHMCKKQNKQNLATRWCRECSEAFCDDCLQLHNLMKFSADHRVVKIEKIDTLSARASEPSFIIDTCSVHKSKVLDAFCFDHQELCCVYCITLHHRKCENIQAIDMIENKKDKIETLRYELTEVKNKTGKLTEEKDLEKVKLNAVFKQIEMEAKTTVISMKKNLDGLLGAFMKELNLIQEEHDVSQEEKSESLKTFMNIINQLQDKSKIVGQHGTLNQMFIHFERSKCELKSATKDAISALNTDSIEDAKFVLNDTIIGVVNADYLGKIDVTKQTAIQCDQYERRLKPTSVLLDTTRPPLSFDNICLQHRKTIHLPGYSIMSCVYCSDRIVMLAGREKISSYKIKAIDISNENILAEYSSSERIKRLAYDFDSKYLFVSCINYQLFSLKFINEFESEIVIKNDDMIGSIMVFEGVLYAIVNKSVKSSSLEHLHAGTGSLETRFDIDTDTGSNCGLVINCKNKSLVHTSYNNALVCTSLDGEIIFSNEEMFQIVSLAIHPNGIVFVGTSPGKIFCVSEDGKQTRKLLNKTKKFVKDISLNASLAVCGNGYLEIYDVLADT
ncbi:Hypothetical predicted protein [Mytilus galloprovincialis]|uniref:TRIM56 n=1 Tax=Mytilus galloprovincialis TaxID=29158 RepID=A0A8B6BFN1_MYTGA|nr:Hypothetical predicted protein [Mytilus galloprovincialis]